MKVLFLTFFLQLLINCIYCQQFPNFNDTLHTTQVMFHIPEKKSCTKYNILIYNSNKKLLLKKSIHSLAYLCSNVLKFEEAYFWKYESLYEEKNIFTSTLVPFFIKGFNKENTSSYKNVVTKQDNKQPSDTIILLDGNGTAIDKNGNVIWQHRTFINDEKRNITFRNISLSAQGEITYLEQSTFNCETINGKVKFASGKKSLFSLDSVEYYHHDGIKLKNGNYLIASYRLENNDSKKQKSNKVKTQYGTILEIDRNNKLVWAWNEKDYITSAEYFKNYNNQDDAFPGNHLNGFDFNPITNDLIVSFRDNNRLVKTNKKTNTLIYDILPNKIKNLNYSGQHSPMFILGNSSSFYFYNNNLEKNKENLAEQIVKNASIIELKEVTKDSLPVKVWEYECQSDSFPKGTIGKEGFVQPLPNGNLLICQGGGNRIFELTKQKEIVWECFTYNYSNNTNKWEPFTNYRARLYSSLYPRYFTVQTKINNSTTSKELKINNDGSDADSYEVLLEKHNGKQNVVMNNIYLKSLQSKTISFTNKQLKGFKKIIVRPQDILGLDFTIPIQ